MMAIGGFLESSLKIWWISGSLPYRDTSTVGTGSSGFRSIESWKAVASYAGELPKDPIRNRASTG